MVYDFIPIILIILSLVIIIVVIIRRLPDLKSLDVASIIEERESEIKKRIIRERFYRKADEVKTKVSPVMKKLLKIIENLIKKLYFKIIELEQSYKERDAKEDREPEWMSIDKLFKKADDYIKEKNVVEAEKVYLEVISLDKNSLQAYQGLGEVYLEKKDYDQAIETFEYLTKSLKAKKNLSNGDKHLLALSLFDLAQIHKNLEKLDKAKKNLKESIKLEPNNPRYLDLMVEICIILKDKNKAQEFLKRLKKANPDNVKIEEFADKIKEI